MNCLIFDIETIPDAELGRKLLDLDDSLSDAQVVKKMQEHQLEKKGTEFLSLHCHKIVAISAVLASDTQVKVWSIGELDDDEATLVSRFFAGVEKYQPTLVSWNGGGFDLPVLHYRALRHKISAPIYWDQGEKNSAVKWNNYISRYHQRHTDVMDLVALYQPRAFAPLNEVALLLGYPGKMGMSGAKVADYYFEGKLNEIRNYCETDVLNTYLVYLRFELMRGHLSEKDYNLRIEQLKATLAASEPEHLKEFMLSWEKGSCGVEAN